MLKYHCARQKPVFWPRSASKARGGAAPSWSALSSTPQRRPRWRCSANGGGPSPPRRPGPATARGYPQKNSRPPPGPVCCTRASAQASGTAPRSRRRPGGARTASRTSGAFGVLWYGSGVLSGVLWRALLCFGVLWCALACSGVFWCASGVLWYPPGAPGACSKRD